MRYLSRILIVGMLFLISTTAIHAQDTTQVYLEGFRHNPPVQTPASGIFNVVLNADTLIVSGEFSNLRTPYWSAAVHYGGENESGNRLYSLHASVNEERTEGIFSAEDNKLVLRPAIIEALRTGKLYINVSSTGFKLGEIRGQIPRMN